MEYQRLKKLCLRLFVTSIAISAMLGIYVISGLAGNWDFELRVLCTTALVAAASICGLTSGGCLSRGHRILPTAGLILTGISAALILIGIWTFPSSFTPKWEWWEYYWKFAWSLAVFAIACGHLSLLFMSNLAGVYRWAYLLAYQLILGLAVLLVAGIVENDLLEKEGYWRTIGVVSILVAAITLLIPVFHRLSRDEVAEMQAKADPLFAVDEEIARVKKRLVELESKRQVLLVRVAMSEVGQENSGGLSS